jgi:hypothetical protein
MFPYQIFESINCSEYLFKIGSLFMILHKYKILEIGADGGSITIYRTYLNNVSLFTVACYEHFDESMPYSNIYLTVEDAWTALKYKFPVWHQLYLVFICTQLTDIVKSDYLPIKNKDEITKLRWLEQLVGKGLGY